MVRAKRADSTSHRTPALSRRGDQVGEYHPAGHGVRRQQSQPARSASIEAILARSVSHPLRLRRLQHLQQQLAVHGDQHVLDGAERRVAAADQRAAVAVLQDRRAVRLLNCGLRIADCGFID